MVDCRTLTDFRAFASPPSLAKGKPEMDPNAKLTLQRDAPIVINLLLQRARDAPAGKNRSEWS